MRRSDAVAAVLTAQRGGPQLSCAARLRRARLAMCVEGLALHRARLNEHRDSTDVALDFISWQCAYATVVAMQRLYVEVWRRLGAAGP